MCGATTVSSFSGGDGGGGVGRSMLKDSIYFIMCVKEYINIQALLQMSPSLQARHPNPNTERLLVQMV